MKSNFYTLLIKKIAEPELLEAIFSNFKIELVNTVSECFLDVLNGKFGCRVVASADYVITRP